mgnify:CR=1 FL=1|tara:strand:- start:897 stop:1424 length:528 start_codon:yes stop_codon:yes gene_type:complete
MIKFELAAFLLYMLPPPRAKPRDAHAPPPLQSASPRSVLQPALDRPAAILALPAPAREHPPASSPRQGKPPPAPPLAPRAAAKRFVTWMQEHGFDGDMPWGGPSGIWEFYLWHCDEVRLQPVPNNMFGDALSAVVKRRQVRDRSTGKLRRFTHYVIPKLPEPVEQPRREPRRRAA